MENWISIHDKTPAPNPDDGESHLVVEVLLDDGTIGEGYYDPVKYQQDWFIRQEPGTEFKGLMYTGVHVTHWRVRPPAKQCPIDKTTLVNVGLLKEYDDGKDNHICTTCKRIWVDVDQDEWHTRISRVQILGELREGVNYADIIRVI